MSMANRVAVSSWCAFKIAFNPFLLGCQQKESFTSTLTNTHTPNKQKNQETTKFQRIAQIVNGNTNQCPSFPSRRVPCHNHNKIKSHLLSCPLFKCGCNFRVGYISSMKMFFIPDFDQSGA